MDKIYEWCNHCGMDTVMESKFEIQECEHCKAKLKPCSMCDTDKVNCNKCNLKGEMENE